MAIRGTRRRRGTRLLTGAGVAICDAVQKGAKEHDEGLPMAICHSNETTWPWYADLAPFSWVVQRDVEAARETINFSEWHLTYDLAHEAGPAVVRQDMPPVKCRMAHPEANLNEQEMFDLARGLNATVGAPGRISAPSRDTP